MRWPVIVVVTGQLVTDRWSQLKPMVHWSASGIIPRVMECIRVVFDAFTESNEGEGENAGGARVRADA